MTAILCMSFQTFAQNVGINEVETIDIGGIKQVISIKGADAAKPVLLYLHGASGNSGASVIAEAEKLTSKLQKYFVVVLWDQRGYGKTIALNESPQTVTLDLLKDDAYEMVEHLLKKFGRRKLYLVGHSLGTVLGFHLAQHYPELVSAFAAISPPVDSVASQKIALNILKKHFRKTNNRKALNELATVKTPANDFESMFIQYRWQAEFDGERVTDEQIAQARPLLKKSLESSGQLFSEMNNLNQMKNIPAVECPVYFFAGRKDFQTNATITEQFYRKLKAPRKSFTWFEKSAHNIPNTEPDLMQETIIKQFLPEGR